MENNRPLLLKRLAYAITVVLVAIAGYFVVVNRHFHLVNTNPTLSKVSTIAPFMKLGFNKDIDPKKVSVTASGDIIGDINVQGKTITLSLKTMAKDKKYSITIKSVTSTGGETITNKTLDFTARFIAFADLPKDQQDTIMQKQAANSKIKSDPILGHLPYGNADFKLRAKVVGASTLSLQAELLLSAADARTDQNAAIQQYKGEVLDYIKSLGLNPDSYTINYVVVMPSLY